MTEIPSKGLLPQLTDVLHALTDSHALLLSKIQSVRPEPVTIVSSHVGLPCPEPLATLDAPYRVEVDFVGEESAIRYDNFRDYNFFDELDAKLAHHGSSEHRPEDR